MADANLEPYVAEQLDGPEEVEFRMVRLLANHEAEHLEAAIASVMEHRGTASLFRLVKANYDALFVHLQQGVQAMQKKKPGDWKVSFGEETNRHIVNFLSTKRMFLDHADRRLKHDFGERAAADFEKLTNVAYDDSFAYRFCQQLRNFVQHRGMPTTSVRFGSHLGARDVGDAALSVSSAATTSAVYVEIERDLLAKDKRIKARFREELAGQPKAINVVAQIRDLVGPLEKLNDHLLIESADRARPQADLVCRVAADARAARVQGFLVLLWAPSGVEPSHLPRIEQLRYTPLPLDEANSILDLAGR